MNNNNRYNGFTVRAVQSTHPLVDAKEPGYGVVHPFLLQQTMDYILTRQRLQSDLWTAYYDARRNKSNKPYQLHFEARCEENLGALCRELWTRCYRPSQSTCFIITDPKRREVFAAQFRDRVVHHLYYNYVHEMLERTFIADTYSCIKERGTHYGIRRLERHIRRESLNYTRPCWVLKMDIRGYFMHISRQRLLDITLRQLERMAVHRVTKGSPVRWCDCVDMDFVSYLTRVIIMQDPTDGCRRHGTLLDWYGLPPEKSLFSSSEGCGLPIGNLTSQLFSNVYLNELDQYVKRVLKVRHYGRYVDDFYIVSADRDWLKSLQRPIARFLRDELGLSVSDEKTQVLDVRYGVEFLGAYLKPRRRYVSNQTLRRMTDKLPSLAAECDAERLRCRLNSFLGILGHYRSYRLRRQLFFGLRQVYRYGYFLQGMHKYVLYPGRGSCARAIPSTRVNEIIYARKRNNLRA